MDENNKILMEGDGAELYPLVNAGASCQKLW